MLDQLIEAPDTSEVVLDAIALVLVNECKNQQNLAREDGKNWLDWQWRQFIEAAAPLDLFRVQSTEDVQLLEEENLPIVNVSYQRSDFSAGAVDSAGRGQADGRFIVDCYAYRPTQLTDGGHKRADEASARAAYRLARIVRNVLMAVEYRDFGLPDGTIAHRYIESIESLRPKANQAAAERIAVVRMILAVRYEEGAPQITPTVIEKISGSLLRAEDGQILATISNAPTPPPT